MSEEIKKTAAPVVKTAESKPTTQATATVANRAVRKPAPKRAYGGGQQRRQRRRRPFKRAPKLYEEKVIDIARVTKVVKGGRRFSFAANVIVGDKKGKIGIGHGKANEVPDAIKKAIKDAQNNLIVVPIINKMTVPHEQKGKFSASRSLVKPAPKGKGIIASGAVRAVVELAGYTDIYTKSYGSRNKANSAKAVLVALSKLRTVEQIAESRDLTVEEVKG